MAWTTLPTYTAGGVLTASQMNAIAANINETCPATATAAGSLVAADGVNSMGTDIPIGTAGAHLVSDGSVPAWRDVKSQENNSGTMTFTNGSYLDLDAVTGGTAGDACTVSIVTGTKARVDWRANFSNNTADAIVYVAYKITGATTQAAADTKALIHESSGTSNLLSASIFDHIALTAGTNVFELQAKTSAGTAAMNRTELLVTAY